MNSKTKAAIALPIIFLLIGTIALLDYHAFSQSPQTMFETTTETQVSTQYLTNVESSISTTTVTTISTDTVEQSLEAGLFQSNNFYILVGGQNGTWFTPSQYPQLEQVSLSTHMVRKLTPALSKGTVWSGNENNSEWLISGWGSDGTTDPNPYLFLYNGTNQLGNNTAINHNSEAEWHGGDIFAISSNGTDWLLSGMGSGLLSSYSNRVSNHLSIGLFNGTYFTDLSSRLPIQMDGILYANEYNGSEWLIGGGYLGTGVLFSFNGTSFTNLTNQIAKEVPTLASIQTIAWNGNYWLIGGAGFLAEYNGSTFTDLTQPLDKSLSSTNFNALYTYNAVNSVAWNGTTWLLGGGEQVGVTTIPGLGWVASFNSTQFTNLTSQVLGSLNSSNSTSGTSILSIQPLPQQDSWIIGGYTNGEGMLLSYDGMMVTNLSNVVSGMTYVIWLGVGTN
jgi:hypothetical protein